MADLLLLEDGSNLILEDGLGALLLEVSLGSPTSDALLQESGAGDWIRLEDGTGFLLLESAITTGALLEISHLLGLGQGDYLQTERITSTGLTSALGTPPYTIQLRKSGKPEMWRWSGTQWIKIG